MASPDRERRRAHPAAMTLVLNAAEGRLMLALGREVPLPGEGLVFAQEWQASGQGVELLMQSLAQAMRALGLAPGDLGRLAVVTGPGSFTGLRLGVVTAAALARALALPQAPLPYLPLLAAAAGAALSPAFPAAGPVPHFWALTHARQGLAHLQGFQGPSRPCPVSPLRVLSLEECAALLRALPPPGPHFLLGSGLRRNQDFFSAALSACPALYPLPPGFDCPSPALLLREALALPGEAYTRRDMEPLYARPGEAEENLPRIATRLGRDPQAAVRRLAELLGDKP